MRPLSRAADAKTTDSRRENGKRERKRRKAMISPPLSISHGISAARLCQFQWQDDERILRYKLRIVYVRMREVVRMSHSTKDDGV